MYLRPRPTGHSGLLPGAPVLALTCLLAAASLHAQSANIVVGITGIRFSNLTGPDFAPYTGSTEGDFTITTTSGSWFQAPTYGNPTPSIYDGPTNSPGPAALLITDKVGQFRLFSLDYSSNNGNTDYDIQGFLGSAMLFEETGTLSGSYPPAFGFQTLSSTDSSTPIDGLIIQLNPEAGVTSVNLDNILVATVPEPGSLGLLAAGLAGLYLAQSRNRRKA